MAGEGEPIIVKKVVKGGHGHHGGAWKVAYADFVTAMMAFFLLLWLLNVTTDEQKAGIADHFSPSSASLSTSGAGGVLGGRTFNPDGAKVSDSGVASVVKTLTPPPPSKEQNEGEDGKDDTDEDRRDAEDITQQEIEEALAQQEQEAFKSTVEHLQQAIQDVPELAELSRHILVDMTPEGMRIQLVDQDQRSMFASGRSELLDHTQALIKMIGNIVQRLPNKIKISGHTDATPFRSSNGYGNWELSTDRANASRRALLQSGLSPVRIAQVTGMADTDPLFPDDPYAPNNRRISIVLLREAKPEHAPTPD